MHIFSVYSCTELIIFAMEEEYYSINMKDKDKTKDELIKELENLKKEHDSLKTSYEKDITGRNLAEEALHASEEKHRMLIEQSIDGIVISDEHGNVSVWNKSMESITGIQQCETIGRPLWEIQLRLIPVEQKTLELLGQLRNILKNLLESKMGWLGEPREQTIIDVNGTHKVVQDSTFMIKTNNKVNFGTIIRDITAHRQSEESLRQEKENFRCSLDASPLGVRIVTMEGKTVYANQAALIIYGYNSIEELQNTSLKDRYTPESYAQAQERKRQRESGDLSATKYEVSIVRKNGEIRHLQVFRKEVLWDGIMQFQIIYDDITERKQAEKEVIKSKKLLEDLHKHLNEIRENERALISREIHDQIGQSLTALKLDLNWMNKYIKNIYPEAAAKLQDMIELVTGTIKDVQRISSELRPGILDDLGLAAAIEWYCDEFEKRTAIKCNLRIDDSIFGDSQKNLVFFRVLQEALTNVIRHANASSVTIKLHQTQKGTTLTIQDNGIGIAAEMIESTNALGLIGMRERVKQFNGAIDISSKKGHGTKLKIFIPS